MLRVVLRGDNVKDEEGFRAVFKVLQPFRRQRKSFWTPSQSFLTSDAISAKLPDCYQCRKKNVLKFGKNLIPSSISRLSLGKKFEEVIFEKGWKKVPSRECTCARSSFLKYLDEFKLVGKEATFINQVYLWCKQKDAKVWSPSVLSKIELPKKLKTNREAGEKDETLEVMIWNVMPETQWKILLMSKNDALSLKQVETLYIDDHFTSSKDDETTGKLSAVCVQNFRKSLCYARIGRPNSLLLVNNLKRSATKWNKAFCKDVANIDQLQSNQKATGRFTYGTLEDFEPLLFGTSQLWKRWHIETLTLAKPGGSHKRKSHSVSLPFTHLFFWVHWPRATQHSQQSHSSQHYLFQDNAAVIQMINPGRNPHLTHVTRTQRIDLDMLCDRVKVGTFYFDNIRVNKRSGWQIFWQWKYFPRCSGIHGDMGGTSNSTMNEMMFGAFLANLSLAQLLEASSDVSGDDTAGDTCPDMESIRTKSIDIRLRFGWSLDLGTIEQQWVSLYSRQEGSSCRNALCSKSGSWYFMSDLEKTGFVRQWVLSTEKFRKCTMQRFTSSQNQSYVWDKERWTIQ